MEHISIRIVAEDTPLFYWSDGWAGTGGDIVAFQGDVYPGASVAGQLVT